jgi:Predicted ATPase (AAA+ superfamily)
MYPEVLSLDNAPENTEYLVNLRNSYLFKDILALEHIRNSQKLQDIVRLLAFQIGNEVSLNGIAVKIGLSKNTVERYLDLLEKAFVIKKISAFSRNLRNEISKSAKYYFWDTGIRNAVINDFRPIELRNDLGALWENFVVMELMKKYEYQRRYASFYFWRTYDQQELDLVVDENGQLSGYEIKWRDDKAKIPHLWVETYKGHTEVITKENLLKVMNEKP